MTTVKDDEVRTKLHDAVVARWGEAHWPAMVYVISNESGFSPCKINGGAVDCNYQGDKACGLPQSLPCSKIRDACGGLTDVDCQVKWTVDYVVNHGYGNPINAAAFWLQHRWW